MSKDSPGKHLVVAVTGASGAIYAVRLLKAGLACGLKIDLVISDYGKRLLIEECGFNLKTETVEAFLDRSYGSEPRTGSVAVHSVYDLGAKIASGSQIWDAMVVIPCSMKTLAGIAMGASTNLIERAADVTLKERRRLILVPRETPLNVIQLDNMAKVARAGADLVPAMPAFYYGPKTFEDLADFMVGRVLSLLHVEHTLFKSWDG